MHRCQRQDFRPLLLSELARYHAAHSRSDGLASFVDEHAGVVVEFDDAAVGPLPFLCRPHYHRMSHVTASNLVCCADRYAVASLGAKIPLFLNDYNDAVACVLGQS
jgi:hypothetical protein